MRRYHHIGIPTQIKQPGETYLERYGVFCTDHERNPFGIQWMRFEPECPLPERQLSPPSLSNMEECPTSVAGILPLRETGYDREIALLDQTVRDYVTRHLPWRGNRPALLLLVQEEKAL